MIKLKSSEEIKRIKESGDILSLCFIELKKAVMEGITTKELDDIAYSFLVKKKAKPAFLGYYDYPATLCVSVNEEVIHGIPGKRKLKRGDIVGIDIGVIYNGFFSDACISLGVGDISKERQKLLKVTEESLYLAIEKAIAGNRISDISLAVYNHCVDHGYDVVRDFCGHGIGFELHEDPQVYNFRSTGPNPRLKPGTVIAIEPMVNQGTGEVLVLEDGWTVVTQDNKDSAHFEHTVAITESGPEILTRHPD
ncbi:MAG: type I methionyl aminopeptidase [Spirochaetales bacterium]|nr:type I methionyl aminopeptidase [Spirochaetales bacterium]